MAVWQLHLRSAMHPGLDEARANALCASARVCMDRHHKSPTKLSVTRDEEPAAEPELAWSEPTQTERNANANQRDATCDGAYAVALVCLESQMNLVAVARAEDLGCSASPGLATRAARYSATRGHDAQGDVL
ncbi:hypothetical protein [Sorangium sp. So ce1335]|uniref:hypothetical protein n=1 Tax=Sorangium sp. So ce1335 TaxID=3133335 RepID=UPI003F5F8170